MYPTLTMNYQELRQKYIKAFRAYYDYGWHVIPCVTFEFEDKTGHKTREKRPLVKWQEFQENPPTPEQVDQWLNDTTVLTCLGLGIVTGTEQGVVGVDFDQKDGKPNINDYANEMIDVMYTITASGGMHAYYKTEITDTPQNATNIFNGDKSKGDTLVDIRGKGGFIVLGPTVLWSGDPRNSASVIPVGTYKTSNVSEPQLLKPFPDVFKKQFETATDQLPKKWEKLASGVVPQGSRHDTAQSIIGKLLYNVSNDADLELARRTFRQIMLKHFQDPLPQEEVDKMFEWATTKEKRKSTAEWQMASSIIKRHQKRQREQQEYEEDKDEWIEIMGEKQPVMIEKITTDGSVDMVFFHLKDGSKFSLTTASIFNQQHFRIAFFQATDISLPKIKNRSLELYIASLKTRIVEGSSMEELVKQTLESWIQRSNIVESPHEVSNLLNENQYGVLSLGGKPKRIYFRMVDLFKTIQRESFGSKKEVIFNATQSIGCKEEVINNFKYWYYEQEK